MDTIALTRQWRALPRELAHIIAEFSGAFKTRNGVLVSQIAKDDPRRDMLLTIPKIILHSIEETHYSLVESIRQLNGNTVITFNLVVEIEPESEPDAEDEILYYGTCCYYRFSVTTEFKFWFLPRISITVCTDHTA